MNQKYAVLIRKWNKGDSGYTPTGLKEMGKQVKTVHRKLKKRSNHVTTEYVIEKDEDRNTYHVHLLLTIDNKSTAMDVFSRYIGGTDWIIRDSGAGIFDECNGEFGMIHIEPVRDEMKYRRYMSKKHEYKVLV